MLRSLPWLFLAFALAAGNPDGMTRIPSGQFQPFFKNQPAVSLPAFFLDSAPVTNREYLIFVRAHPEWRRDRTKRIFADAAYLKHWLAPDSISPESAEMPVTHVSFFAARAYCNWREKRLPTLAEWEFALNDHQNGNPGLKPVAGLWEWVSDFNSVMISAESRAGADKDLFCGGGVVNGKDPRSYDTYMRYAFRSSLKANYNTANLGFRCARDL
ncbi:MAG: formylglycine-generating enzyme family protein [Leptospirales bacterium]|nr:formylglycine-generating enzyme family protein [Leptospirales bacterium]